MNATHAVILIGGSFLLMWAMVAWMLRANKREKEVIERRHQEWIAAGSNPDEKPNFFSGSAGGTGS
jgi:hypothetical protein